MEELLVLLGLQLGIQHTSIGSDYDDTITSVGPRVDAELRVQRAQAPTIALSLVGYASYARHTETARFDRSMSFSINSTHWNAGIRFAVVPHARVHAGVTLWVDHEETGQLLDYIGPPHVESTSDTRLVHEWFFRAEVARYRCYGVTMTAAWSVLDPYDAKLSRFSLLVGLDRALVRY